MIRHLAPAEAKAAVHAGTEIAFLDVREAGPFSMGHPLFVVPCPFSRLELTVGTLVPRRAVPVLLIDGGDGVAERAAEAMAAMGYADIAIVTGGAPAWAAAGFTLYKGVNVPSKTLGELAEHAMHPKTIDATTLSAWKAEGRNFRFYDCRPPAEYAKMRVPGALCLPNGELAHRFDMAADDGPVVITCAGRTRGIIGVLGLAVAGIEGEVHALENGTQGWALSGQTLERGNPVNDFPIPDADALARTRARADALIAREGLSVIDAALADRLRHEQGRTTFLFDVRSEAEAQADPLPAFAHALSGQIVQATDQWVGVRHARLILADDAGLRAAIAAYWLRALGFEVHVLRIDDAARALTPLPVPAAAIQQSGSATAAEALAALRGGAAVLLDLRGSGTYRNGHVSGARWTVRAHLPGPEEVAAKPLLVIAGSAEQAALAAADLSRMGHASVRVVAGGHAALVEAGARIVATPNSPSDAEAVDFTWFAHGRHDGDLAASRLYLTWEQGLIAQLDPEERAEFALPATA
ncbi:rhodanese [Halovulum dunhuangense]|uniref:Rhodanese n=1 Tax=Halovulum dunhuangense TaxID=1505036 RepID=A0A849L1M7_9RHOB|nr:rhodanese-like domain-containing protein [Halovulum dunhuangense]NNU80170.1 rhodanese [Halovulum dunhuangense]